MTFRRGIEHPHTHAQTPGRRVEIVISRDRHDLVAVSPRPNGGLLIRQGKCSIELGRDESGRLIDAAGALLDNPPDAPITKAGCGKLVRYAADQYIAATPS